MKKFTLAFPLILVTFCLFSCKQQTSKTTEDQIHFTLQSPAETGITFNNTITENDSVNLIENEYTYMGAGVGIGDFNNDNLPDVFFTANQKSSELYINKGNFKFENVTQKAGITTDYWGTGASIVDINGDGYDDIYVCVSETRNPYKRKNHLYVNNK